MLFFIKIRHNLTVSQSWKNQMMHIWTISGKVFKKSKKSYKNHYFERIERSWSILNDFELHQNWLNHENIEETMKNFNQLLNWPSHLVWPPREWIIQAFWMIVRQYQQLMSTIGSSNKRIWMIRIMFKGKRRKISLKRRMFSKMIRIVMKYLQYIFLIPIWRKPEILGQISAKTKHTIWMWILF